MAIAIENLHFLAKIKYQSSNLISIFFLFIKLFFFKKVKKPLACGLHDIASIIGQEKAEKDLFGVLDSILKDTSK